MRSFSRRESVAVSLPDVYGASLMLGVVVFLACLLGIHTRPDNFLASVWPANAVMLGFLLRVPAAAGLPGWGCAGLAFLAADLLTGSSLLKAILLNTANLAGVAAACAVYGRLPAEMARLRHPMSMLYLVLASALAGTAAGMVGGLVNPLLFGGDVLRGWTFWFSTEFVNYIAILPMILAAPPLRALTGSALQRRPWAWPAWRRLPPAAALVVTCLAAWAVGGPGAIAFPVPALLWCGLSYPVFPTAVLTFFAGCWTLIVVAASYAGQADAHDEMVLVSLRLGVSLIALAPIMLSCVMQSRNDLLARLQHVASHDALTGVSSRGAFLERAGRLLGEATGPVGGLMIDIDHFKQVNDRHGHAAGDAVLVEVARRVRGCLRPADLFGRVGGEEFAAVVDGQPGEVLRTIAERIRAAVAATPIPLPDGSAISLTVSLGLATATGPVRAGIDGLMAAADKALYQAKHAGRDRVAEAAGPP